jgi:AcrR family transcriptional regulator
VNTPTSSLVPPAVQERSRRTVRQIIATGTKLLEDGGPDALTIAAVAQAAGVAVGSVYQRFGTKEKLLTIIQTEFTDDFLIEFKRRMSDAHISKSARPVDVVKVAVTGLAETFRTHKKLLRVFMLLATQKKTVLDIGAEASHACAEAFRTLLLKAKPAIRRPNIAASIDHAYRLVYASCAHRVVYGEYVESELPYSWSELTEELYTIVALYLFGRLDPKSL